MTNRNPGRVIPSQITTDSVNARDEELDVFEKHVLCDVNSKLHLDIKSIDAIDVSTIHTLSLSKQYGKQHKKYM